MEFVHYTNRIKARAGKKKTFRVKNNRILFRCTNCGAKRSYSVPPNLRRKNLKCHKCKTITKCIFDKRIHRRESQTGKVNLQMTNGKNIEANLLNISPKGVGMEVPPNLKRSHILKPGHRVTFRCNWNRRLLGGRYVVKNVNGRKIGFEKLI